MGHDSSLEVLRSSDKVWGCFEETSFTFKIRKVYSLEQVHVKALWKNEMLCAHCRCFLRLLMEPFFDLADTAAQNLVESTPDRMVKAAYSMRQNTCKLKACNDSQDFGVCKEKKILTPGKTLLLVSLYLFGDGSISQLHEVVTIIFDLN